MRNYANVLCVEKRLALLLNSRVLLLGLILVTEFV
ncbi:MAG: hypothetical protein ACI8RT_001334 [Candidatus Azotimanducaceae bacterium]|jgi:hypothetical protein